MLAVRAQCAGACACVLVSDGAVAPACRTRLGNLRLAQQQRSAAGLTPHLHVWQLANALVSSNEGRVYTEYSDRASIAAVACSLRLSPPPVADCWCPAAQGRNSSGSVGTGQREGADEARWTPHMHTNKPTWVRTTMVHPRP